MSFLQFFKKSLSSLSELSRTHVFKTQQLRGYQQTPISLPMSILTPLPRPTQSFCNFACVVKKIRTMTSLPAPPDGLRNLKSTISLCLPLSPSWTGRWSIIQHALHSYTLWPSQNCVFLTAYGSETVTKVGVWAHRSVFTGCRYRHQQAFFETFAIPLMALHWL